MFDFLKDIYLETHGIDSNHAKKEFEEKKEKKMFFPGRTKVVIIMLAIIFILMQVFQIMALAEKGVGYLVAAILLCLIALAIVILLLMKNKKTEIAAAVLIGLFVILDYAYTYAFFL